MSIRDDELKRIQLYAEGLGCKVHWYPYVPRSMNAATWHMDGSQIEVYVNKRRSKSMLILDILHELGHHHWWLNLDRTIPKEVDIAIGQEMSKKSTEILDKPHRRSIYLMERDSAEYHEYIFDQLQLKIPKWKMIVEKELSNWIYYRYYVTGKWPIRKSKLRKRKELTEKYKGI